MAKIHNQKKLEDSVARCDTLAANMIERRDELLVQKLALLKDNEDQVMDFIFGRSDENPLEDITSQMNDDFNEYKDTCALMTSEVLASVR